MTQDTDKICLYIAAAAIFSKLETPENATPTDLLSEFSKCLIQAKAFNPVLNVSAKIQG